MMMSPDRQTFLAQTLVDALYYDDMADFSDEDAATRLAQKSIEAWVKEEELLHQAVHAKIKSLKKQVVEGSPEYDILFKKYEEEERRRRGDR